MHKIVIGETKIPTVKEAISVLQSHTDRPIGVPLDYDRMLEYDAYYTIKGNHIREKIIKYTGMTVTPLEFKAADFGEWLVKAGVKTGLLLTDSGEISLGKKSLQAAIATGLYSDEIVKIIEMYIEQARAFKAISVFGEIFKNYPIASIESWDNHRMLLTHPRWTPQNTGRIGAENPGLMNFSHEIHDIYTVPKGYVYYEIDSGQIEPRIIQSAYLRDPQLKACTNLYNDAYFGYIHYCTVLTDEERRSGTLDIKPIEITDAMREKRDKFKTFGNATMYGSTENNLNDPDKAAFIKYIGGHPNRVRWQNRNTNAIDGGERIFYSAFGTPIDITKGPSDADYTDKNSNAYINHLVKCSINNPIQATGADLMRYSVLAADALLREKAPASQILQYVHDAGKFAIHEDEVDDIINELKEITAYQVDDWIPIYAKLEEGVHPGDVKRFIA